MATNKLHAPGRLLAGCPARLPDPADAGQKVARVGKNVATRAGGWLAAAHRAAAAAVPVREAGRIVTIPQPALGAPVNPPRPGRTGAGTKVPVLEEQCPWQGSMVNAQGDREEGSGG